MQKLSLMMQGSPLWQRVRNWYELLAPKDRRAVQALSLTLVCTLIYFLVWEPVTNWATDQEAAYQDQLEIHEWLGSNKNRVFELKKNQNSGVGHRELSSIVGVVARKSEITLNRVQPDKKGLSVWIEDAAYQKVLKWLVVLENKHGVLVQQIRIDKLKEEGRVKGYIHLVK